MSKLLSVLEVVSTAQKEIGITQTTLGSVLTSSDQDIVQMAALIAAVADEVLAEMPYKVTLGDGIWCAASDGTPRPIGPKEDSDVILFDGRLAINGLKMRFRAAKGLEFGEDLRDFTTRLSKLAVDAAPVIDVYADEGREL
jgi:hypothetical protein